MASEVTTLDGTVIEGVTKTMKTTSEGGTILEVYTLPMDEHRRWMIKVRMITRNEFRKMFGSDKSDKWGHWSDHYMAQVIGKYSDWVIYPKGDSILKGHSSTVYTAVISSDGHHLYTGSDDHCIIKYNLLTNLSMKQWTGHDDTIRCLAYHRSGLLISGGFDLKIKVWNAFKNDDLIHTLEGHSNKILSVSVNNEGTQVVSGSVDLTVRVWSMDDGQCLRVLRGHTQYVPFVDFAGEMIISASGDPLIKLWDSKDGSLKRTVTHGVSHLINDVTLNSDASLMACMCGYGGLSLLKWPGMEPFRTIRGHCQQGCFHPCNPDIIAVYNWKPTPIRPISIYSVSQDSFIRQLDGHSGDIYSLVFTQDGTRLISTSVDNTTRIWDVSDL